MHGLRDHSSYDLFRCAACKTIFLRRQFADHYPQHKCPHCQTIADERWKVSERPEDREQRISRIMLLEARMELRKAHEVHGQALQRYYQAHAPAVPDSPIGELAFSETVRLEDQPPLWIRSCQTPGGEHLVMVSSDQIDWQNYPLD
jgi:phage FluMu protein Com